MPVIRSLRREEGNVLVIAIMMMMLMLAIGLAALATVDTQTDVSKKERERESTFNLSEAALNAQTFVLGRSGTGNSGKLFPSQCPATPTDDLCPDPQQIARSYDAASQPDFDAAQTTWNTIVRDNTGGTLFYDPANEATADRYDANADKQMWVKSTAVVRGKTRSIVALIKVEDRPIAFPEYGINAGFFYTTNNGNKVIVDSTGSLGVAVRPPCTAPAPVNCLGYDAAKGQLTPAGNTATASSSTAISTDDLQALEDYAKASGTYYAGCPADPNGQVVVVESGDCVFNNSSPAASGQARCCNSADKPGLLIIKRGTLTLLGSITYEGLIYMPNLSPASSGTLVTTSGTALIRGGVTIDGPGGLAAGSSGLNVKFDVGAFQRVHTIGTAGVVQNTWREIIG